MIRFVRGVGTTLRIAGAVLIVASLIGDMVPTTSHASVYPVSASARANMVATPTPAPIGKDLSTLTPTATGPLFARFVADHEANAGMVARRIIVDTTLGATLELRVNGILVPATHLGSLVSDPKKKLATFTYYGIALQPGPNTVSVTPLGAGNLRGATVTQTMYGADVASSVTATVTPMQKAFLADNVSTAVLKIIALDRFGHAALPGERVLVEIQAGDVSIVSKPHDDASHPPTSDPSPAANAAAVLSSRSTRHVEFALPPSGVLSVTLLAGVNPGPIKIRATIGTANATARSYLEAPVRHPFVNGLASIGSGAQPGQVDGADTFDAGGARKQRLAVFGMGKIGRDTSLTLVYESQNRLSPLSSVGGYVDNPSQRPYQTYGDSSTVTDPYHSNDHLYARIDRGHSSLLWGQYMASVAPNTIGSYSQLLSGAKARLSFGHDDRVTLTGFTARNQVAFASQTIPVSGLANLQTPLQPNIVVGSDYFVVVTLSKSTGAPIGQQVLVRNQDYSIDYATGIVRFINVPLPFDPNFNPRALVLQYQYAGPGVQSQTTGAQSHLILGKDRGTRLSAGFVNDAFGSGNFTLMTQSFERHWADGSISIVNSRSNGVTPGTLTAMGTTASPAPAGGSALSMNLVEHHRFDNFSASFIRTSGGYSDPFGGISTPGLSTYRASWDHAVPGVWSLGLEADGAQNFGNGAPSSQANAQLLLTRQFGKRWKINAGIQRHIQSVSAGATPVPSPGPLGPALAQTSQTQAVLGAEYRANDHVTLSAERITTFSGSDVGSTQPSQTVLQLTYGLGNRGRLYARELWSSQPAATFATSTQSLVASAASTHAFEIGAEESLSPATAVSTDYQMLQTSSGTNLYSTIGVREQLHFGKNLAGSAFLQGANAVGTGAAGFTVYGVALAYHRGDALQSTLAYQRRTGMSGGSTASFGLSGPLGPNAAVVTSLQRSYGVGTTAINDQFSLAYRPMTNDQFITLFSYQRANGFFGSSSISSVASVDQIIRPTRRTEFAAKYAVKLDGDTFYTAHTSLLAFRLTQRIGKRTDIGVAVRYLNIPGVNGAFQTDSAVEVGHLLGNMTRLSVGYTFRGTVDPTLLGQPKKKGFYVTISTLIDRIFGWGKAHAKKP